LPADAVYFGEIGLSGAVRPVIHSGLRLKEAAKLGFSRAIIPESGRESFENAAPDMRLLTCGHIATLVSQIAQTAEEEPVLRAGPDARLDDATVRIQYKRARRTGFITGW
jgi:DNA repair protein RadA/Sms